MEVVNVDGARNVFEAAIEAGVPRIVYTSTAAVHGDTKGQMVDETHQIPFEALRSSTVYEQTKWRAHHEVALPMIRKGAPIVIVESGGAYGPGQDPVRSGPSFLALDGPAREGHPAARHVIG
jgi:dihydroflavonol-4-reductase